MRLKQLLTILVATAVLFAGSQGVAAPFAYVSNSRANTVSVIDLATNAVVASVPVGNGPYGVAVHAGIGRVYVTNHDSNSVSVIDTITNMVVATIPVGFTPTGIAVNPAGTRVYVACTGSNAVYVIDTATNAYLSSPIQVGVHPMGVAVAGGGGVVYVANVDSGSVSRIDAATNAVTMTIGIGGTPFDIAINAAGTRAYVTQEVNGVSKGVVFVLDLRDLRAVATVDLDAHLMAGIHNVAINPAATRVFVTAGGTEIVVIDATTNTYLRSVAVGANPIGVAFDAGGSHAYVASNISNIVSVIDVGTLTASAMIPVSDGPVASGVFIDPAAASGSKAAPFIAMQSSPNPSITGQTVNITAAVSGSSGTPTGTIVFQDDGVAIIGCTDLPMTNGGASCSLSALSAGTHPITAVYSGDGAYNAVTSSPLQQTVNKKTPSITLASTANPSTVGQYLIFTAVASGSSGTPTGTIVFRDNGTGIGGCLGVQLSNGRATCTIGNLTQGTHSMTAAYTGDDVYGALTSSTLPQVVNPAKPNTPSITLGSSVNPSTMGQVVEFTGVVSGSAGTPTGKLVFLDDSNVISGCAGLAMTNGRATCSPGNLTQGTHAMTAVYSGDSTYNGVNSSNLPQAVNPAKPNTPSFTLGSSMNPSTAGQMVTFTAVLSGTAGTVTGNVVFRDNGMTISGCGGIALTNGRVTCTPPLNTAGTHSITGIYLGDSNYNGVTSSVLPQTVQ